MLLVIAVLASIMVAPPALAGGPASGAEYVALGDSYAAGEGLGDYEAGTDVVKRSKRNVCHRSLNDAYATVIEPRVLPEISDRAFWACSGATSTDMMKPGSNSNQAGQPNQVQTVAGSTHYVTISAGGNDVGFGDLGLACATVIVDHKSEYRLASSTCAQQLETARRRFSATRANLAKLYTALLTNAPSAIVNVVGYPRILPADYSGAPTLLGRQMCILNHYRPLPLTVVDAGMWVDDAQNVDQFVRDLNQLARDAISDVRAVRPRDAGRLVFTSVYENSVPRTCNHDSPGDVSVNGVQLSLSFSGVGRGERWWRKTLKSAISTATFHPTKAGQKMFAQQVQATFDNMRLRLIGGDVTIVASFDQSYFAQRTLLGGAQPFTASVSPNGSQPPGFTASVNGDTVTVAGDATNQGSWTLLVSVTDAVGQSIAFHVFVDVEAPPPPGALELVDWDGTAINSAQGFVVWSMGMTVRGSGPIASNGDFQQGKPTSSLSYQCFDPPGSTVRSGGGGGAFPLAEDLVSVNGDLRVYRRAGRASGQFAGECHGYSLHLVDSTGGLAEDFTSPEMLTAAGFQRTWSVGSGFQPSVEMRLAHPKNNGYAHDVILIGSPQASELTVSCYASGSATPYSVETVPAQGSPDNAAVDVCFSDVPGEHWAVVNGVRSNSVYWGG